MGGRDFRRHETKKPKKGVKKSVAETIIPQPVTVEVIKKGKKTQEGEE